MIIIIRLLPNPILRHHLNLHTLEINRQSPLQLIRAHPQDLHSLLEADVRVVVLVQRRQAVVLRVAVCGVGQWCCRRQVVYPVELGLVLLVVEAAEKEVDCVWVAGAERFGEFRADEGGDFVWRKLRTIAFAVELDVGLDVFCELDWGRSSVCRSGY